MDSTAAPFQAHRSVRDAARQRLHETYDDVQRIGEYGVWRLDLGSGELLLSDRAAAIYGLPQDALPLTLQALFAGISSDDTASVEVAFDRLLADGATIDVLHRVRGNGTTVRYARLRGEAVRAPAGRIVEALGIVQDVSREHARDEALRASEARLSSVFAALAEGVVIQDDTGRVVDANDAACRILGLSRDEILGRTSVDPRWQSVHEDGTPYPGAAHPAMLTLMTGEPVSEALMGVIAPKFGQRWISINSVPIAHPGRMPHAVVTTFVDVTQRRADQHRLAAKAARLRDLYDHAPCGYHSIGKDGRYVEINDIGLSWLGCSRSQVVGLLGPSDFLEPDDRDRVARGLAQLIDGQPQVGYELDLYSRDGTVRRVAARATAVRDAEGGFVMSRTVLHDVTDLRRVERLLRRQAVEQRLMLDNDLVGIVKLRERRATWINRAMSRIFGYSPSELEGQPARMLYLDDASYEQLGASAYPVLKSGERFHAQIEMRRRDGTPVWIDMNGIAMPDGTDESLWMLGDITELKHAEAQRLRAVRQQIETGPLMSADRLRSQFLAAMSHELRVPLDSMIGFTDLIRSGAVRSQSPQFDEFLEYVGTSGRHLLRLIETILEFATSPSKAIAFETIAVRIDALVRESVGRFERAAGEKSIAIESTVDPTLGRVCVDPVRMKQVLHAYLSNAIAFSPANSVVSVAVRPEGDEMMRVEVTDRGVGIAAADLPHLFTATPRLGEAARGRPGGIAMGLALSRSLVEAQGGSVGVRSESGVGSVFHFVLPTRRGELGPIAPEPIPAG